MLFLIQDVEATKNLRYITSGLLKTSRYNFDPASGQITLSLRVEDPRWQPRFNLDNWNPSTKTFTEVGQQRKSNLTPTGGSAQ